MVNRDFNQRLDRFLIHDMGHIVRTTRNWASPLNVRAYAG